MVGSVVDEIIHILLDIVYATLHGGDGIALACHADSYAPLGTELLVGYASRAASMPTIYIATKDKHLVGTQTGVLVRKKLTQK